MVVSLPKPLPGASRRYFPNVTSVMRSQSWPSNNDDTDTTHVRTHDDAGTSYVGNRSNNHWKRLDPETVWRPCSAYQTAFSQLYLPEGTRRWINTSSGSHKGTTRRLDTGNLDHANPKRGHTSSGRITTTGLVAAMPTNIRNRIGTELMVKVADRKVDYGEALAEAKTTANHLARSASDLARVLLAARKGNWKKVSNILGLNPKRKALDKSAGNRWLEYQYGWLPLIGDIYDTYGLLTDGFRRNRMVASSVRRLETTYTDDTGDRSDPTKTALSHTTRVVDTAKVYYSIKESRLAYLSQLGLINPAEVAWAVVPYSFVVDWVLPVGDFLEALTARLGIDFIDGYYSSTVTSKTWYRPAPPSVYQGKCVVNDMTAVTMFSGYRRTRMSNFPTPALYVKSPFSTTHVVSAAALIRQLK